ncbi:MAG TPA: hypothetical protein VJV74_05030 [Terriglobia bacterium]|nr:hypothetical protein [Terriglobia bacterium]
MDLEGGCGLRESLAGYDAALRRASFRFVRDTSDRVPPSRTVIVPGCARLDPSVAKNLQASLHAGALVLVESGAAYADPTEFAGHQTALDTHFGLKIEEPVHLWPTREGASARGREAASSARVPYVDLIWPIEAKVRDFSRVVPLCASESAWTARGVEPIGWVEGRPMAAHQTRGRGSLIYLGSPLGPALRYGDREAERWFNALLKLA